MAKLIFSLDGALLGEYPLDKECITIGRRAANDIHIDNLAVSGHHAEVVTTGKDFFLEDLGSTNGTKVNGKLIKKHILKHGDVIGIGRYQLKYVSEAVINAAVSGGNPKDPEKTLIARSSAANAVAETELFQNQNTVSEPPPAPVPPAATSGGEPARVELPLAYVKILNGPGVGEEKPLNKALVALGKQGVQVAVITRRPHGYFITHVEGKKHPVVNGQSVGFKAYLLTDHDVIEIAGVRMEFYLAPA